MSAFCHRALRQPLKCWTIAFGLSRGTVRIWQQAFQSISVNQLQGLQWENGNRTSQLTQQGRSWNSVSHCVAPRKLSVSVSGRKESTASGPEKDEYTLVYRFPSILFLRAMSRLKILQTGLTVVLCPLMMGLYGNEQISFNLLAYGFGIMTFAGVMLYWMSAVSRSVPVVGLINVNKSLTVAKVSHLTFWGRRADKYLDIKSVIPISDLGEDDVYVKLKTYTSKEEMKLFLKWGQIIDKQKLEHVIGPF